MKDIIALATIFCLVGGYGMAAEHRNNKRPPAAVNGDEWSRNNQKSRLATEMPMVIGEVTSQSTRQ